ncbi:MAG: YwiC-like family protein [Candidatus Latescibacterota bacterium]
MNLDSKTFSLPPLPKEHGAWGVFVGAFLSAAAVLGSLGLAQLLLFLALGTFYLAHPTLILLSRRKARRNDVLWSALFFLMGVLFIIRASSTYRPIILYSLIVVPFAISEILFIHRRKRQTLHAQAIGVTGLSSIAPLSMVLHERELTWGAAVLWTVTFCFFMSGILFARFQIARLNARSHPDVSCRRERGTIVVYHLVVAGMLVWLVLKTQVTVFSTVVFLPATAVSLLAAAKIFPSTAIRYTGWLIVAQTILFVLLLAVVT